MKEFDFAQIGKRSPFRTPEGYLEQQEEMLKSAVGIPSPAVRPFPRRWRIAVAACSVLAVAAFPLAQWIHETSSPRSVAEETPVYSRTTATEDWSDFAEADLFLDNMNW